MRNLKVMDELIKKAAGIIKTIRYINIASITPDGKPWNSPVYCAFDKDLNFFWLSWKQNQHSINVRNNPNVFITIYDSTVLCSTGVGVYLEGTAKQLNSPKDVLLGIKEVYSREKRKARDVLQFLKKFPRRVYRFSPNRVWINGNGEIDGNFIDVRTELDLDKLKFYFK